MKRAVTCPLCGKLWTSDFRADFGELPPILTCRQCDDRPAEVRYVDALRRSLENE